MAARLRTSYIWASLLYVLLVFLPGVMPEPLLCPSSSELTLNVSSPRSSAPFKGGYWDVPASYTTLAISDLQVSERLTGLGKFRVVHFLVPEGGATAFSLLACSKSDGQRVADGFEIISMIVYTECPQYMLGSDPSYDADKVIVGAEKLELITDTNSDSNVCFAWKPQAGGIAGNNYWLLLEVADSVEVVQLGSTLVAECPCNFIGPYCSLPEIDSGNNDGKKLPSLMLGTLPAISDRTLTFETNPNNGAQSRLDNNYFTVVISFTLSAESSTIRFDACAEGTGGTISSPFVKLFSGGCWHDNPSEARAIHLFPATGSTCDETTRAWMWEAMGLPAGPYQLQVAYNSENYGESAMAPIFSNACTCGRFGNACEAVAPWFTTTANTATFPATASFSGSMAPPAASVLLGVGPGAAGLYIDARTIKGTQHHAGLTRGSVTVTACAPNSAPSVRAFSTPIGSTESPVTLGCPRGLVTLDNNVAFPEMLMLPGSQVTPPANGLVCGSYTFFPSSRGDGLFPLWDSSIIGETGVGFTNAAAAASVGLGVIAVVSGGDGEFTASASSSCACYTAVSSSSSNKAVRVCDTTVPHRAISIAVRARFGFSMGETEPVWLAPSGGGVNVWVPADTWYESRPQAYWRVPSVTDLRAASAAVRINAPPLNLAALSVTSCTAATLGFSGRADTLVALLGACPAGGNDGAMGLGAHGITSQPNNIAVLVAEDTLTTPLALCATARLDLKDYSSLPPALYAQLDAPNKNEGEGGATRGNASIAYSWACACGWGDWDCTARVPPTENLVTLKAVPTTGHGWVTWDASDGDANSPTFAVDVLGSPGPDALLIIKVPDGLPQSTLLRISTCPPPPVTNAVYLWPDALADRPPHAFTVFHAAAFTSNHRDQCLAGGAPLIPAYVMAVAAGPSPTQVVAEQFVGCATVDLSYADAQEYGVAVESLLSREAIDAVRQSNRYPVPGSSGPAHEASASGFLRMQVICACGTHGPACTTLPALRTLSARIESVSGSLSVVPIVVTASSFEAALDPLATVAGSGSIGNFTVSFAVTVDAALSAGKPVAAHFTTCNDATRFGRAGKVGVGRTTIALYSTCAASADAASLAYDDPMNDYAWPLPPTTAGTGVASMRALARADGDEVYPGDGPSGCSTMDVMLQSGSTYLIAVGRAPGALATGVFYQLDYSIAYPKEACEATPQLQGWAGVATGVIDPKVGTGSTSTASVLSDRAVKFALSLPASLAPNMTLTISTCGAETGAADGVGDTIVAVQSSCTDDALVLAKNDEMPPPYNNSALRCMEPSYIARYGPSRASFALNNVIGGSSISVSVGPGSRAPLKGGKFSLNYVFTCPCGSFGDYCEQRGLTTKFITPVNTVSGTGILLSSRAYGSAYGQAAVPDILFSITAPTTLGTLPRALAVTVCVGGAGISVTPLMRCPASYGGAADMNPSLPFTFSSASGCSTFSFAPWERESWFSADLPASVIPATVSLSWKYSCGCWLSGDTCSKPIPRGDIPTASPLYSGSMAFRPLDLNLFLTSTKEVIFTWIHPGVATGVSMNHIKTLTFSTAYSLDTNCKTATWARIVALGGCVGDGMSLKTPAGSLDAMPPMWVGKDAMCATITLDAAALEVAALARVVTVIVEPQALYVNSGSFNLVWSYACIDGWGGVGCSQPIPAPLSLSTGPASYSGSVITSLGEGGWANFVGGSSPDAVFRISVASQTESIYITTCSPTTSLPNGTGAGSTNLYIWDASTNPPLAGGRSLDGVDGYTVLKKIVGERGCSSVFLKPSDVGGDLGGVYYVVIEAADTEGSGGLLGVSYNRTCMCGWYGDRCDLPLSIVDLNGKSGVTQGETFAGGINLRGDFTSGPEAYFSYTVPDILDADPNAFSLRLSTCNAYTAAGMHDPVIAVFTQCLGGGRLMEPVMSQAGLPIRNDDTVFCALGFIMTGMRSQLALLDAPGLSPGVKYYIQVFGYSTFTFGQFSLEWVYSCDCGRFGLSCDKSASSTALSLLTDGTLESPLKAPAMIDPAAPAEARFLLAFSSPVSQAVLTACSEAGFAAPALVVNSKCWADGAGAAIAKKSAAAGAGGAGTGCTQLAFVPFSANIDIALSGAADTKVSLTWATTCPCHTTRNLTTSAPLGSCGGRIDSPYLKYWQEAYQYTSPARYMSEGHNFGFANPDSPSVFVTFANPTTDAGQFRQSHLESVTFSTCDVKTTLATRLVIFSRCVAGGFTNMDDLGVIADSGSNDAPNEVRIAAGVPSAQCSALTLNAMQLANRDMTYFDMMATTRSGAPLRYDTVVFSMSYVCMCGSITVTSKPNEPCLYNVKDNISPVGWSRTTAPRWAQTIDAMQGVRLLDSNTPRSLFSFSLGPDVVRINITTCLPDFIAGQTPYDTQAASARLVLIDASVFGADFTEPPLDTRYHCLAGGVRTSQLPILATSSPGSCATITLSSTASPSGLLGSYILSASSHTNDAVSVTFTRTCRTGFNGVDCTAAGASIYAFESTALAGSFEGSTQDAQPLVLDAPVLGNANSQVAIKIDVPADVAVLTVHTCLEATIDSVVGVGDTVLALLRGQNLARGQTPNDVDWFRANDNAGSVFCPADPMASLVTVNAPAPGKYSLLVAGMNGAGGTIGVSWSLRCHCGFGGSNCGTPLPTPTAVSAGVRVFSLKLSDARSLAMADFSGFPDVSPGNAEAKVWLFTVPPLSADAVRAGTLLRITTCLGATATPALIAVADPVLGCPSSGARIDDLSALGLTLPPASLSRDSTGCSELQITGAQLIAKGMGSSAPLSVIIGRPPGAHLLGEAFAVEIDYDCACGVFSSSSGVCDVAALPITKLVSSGTGNSFMLSATGSLSPSARTSRWPTSLGGVDESAEAIFSFAVPLHATVTLSTCNPITRATATGLKETALTVSTRCPAAFKSQSLEAINVVAQTRGTCPNVTVQKVGGQILHVMVEAATPERAAEGGAFRLDASFTCLCGWSGTTCSIPPPINVVDFSIGLFKGSAIMDAGVSQVVLPTPSDNRFTIMTLPLKINTASVTVTTCTEATAGGVGSTRGLVLQTATSAAVDAASGTCLSVYSDGLKGADTPGIVLGTVSAKGSCHTAVMVSPPAGILNILVALPAPLTSVSDRFSVSYSVQCACGFGGWGVEAGGEGTTPGSCATDISTLNSVSSDPDTSGSFTTTAPFGLLSRATAPFPDVKSKAAVIRLTLPTDMTNSYTALSLSTCEPRTRTGMISTGLYLLRGCVAGGRPLASLVVVGDEPLQAAAGSGMGCSSWSWSFGATGLDDIRAGRIYAVVAAPASAPLTSGAFALTLRLSAPSSSATPTPTAPPKIAVTPTGSRTPARTPSGSATPSSSPGSSIELTVTIGGVPAAVLLEASGVVRPGILIRLGIANIVAGPLAFSTLQSVGDAAFNAAEPAVRGESSTIDEINAGVAPPGTGRLLRQQQRRTQGTTTATAYASRIIVTVTVSVGLLASSALLLVANTNSSVAFISAFPLLAAHLAAHTPPYRITYTSSSAVTKGGFSAGTAEAAPANLIVLAGAIGGGLIFILGVIGFIIVRNKGACLGCPKWCGRKGGFGALPVAIALDGEKPTSIIGGSVGKPKPASAPVIANTKEVSAIQKALARAKEIAKTNSMNRVATNAMRTSTVALSIASSISDEDENSSILIGGVQSSPPRSRNGSVIDPKSRKVSVISRGGAALSSRGGEKARAEAALASAAAASTQLTVSGLIIESDDEDNDIVGHLPRVSEDELISRRTGITKSPNYTTLLHPNEEEIIGSSPGSVHEISSRCPAADPSAHKFTPPSQQSAGPLLGQEEWPDLGLLLEREGEDDKEEEVVTSSMRRGPRPPSAGGALVASGGDLDNDLDIIMEAAKPVSPQKGAATEAVNALPPSRPPSRQTSSTLAGAGAAAMGVGSGVSPSHSPASFGSGRVSRAEPEVFAVHAGPEVFSDRGSRSGSGRDSSEYVAVRESTPSNGTRAALVRVPSVVGLSPSGMPSVISLEQLSAARQPGLTSEYMFPSAHGSESRAAPSLDDNFGLSDANDFVAISRAPSVVALLRAPSVVALSRLPSVVALSRVDSGISLELLAAARISSPLPAVALTRVSSPLPAVALTRVSSPLPADYADGSESHATPSLDNHISFSPVQPPAGLPPAGLSTITRGFIAAPSGSPPLFTRSTLPNPIKLGPVGHHPASAVPSLPMSSGDTVSTLGSVAPPPPVTGPSQAWRGVRPMAGMGFGESPEGHRGFSPTLGNSPLGALRLGPMGAQDNLNPVILAPRSSLSPSQLAPVMKPLSLPPTILPAVVLRTAALPPPVVGSPPNESATEKKKDGWFDFN